MIKAAQVKLSLWKEKAAERDHSDSECKGQEHYLHKFRGRNIKVRVEIEVLRVSEWGEHTAEISGNILKNEELSHMLFIIGTVQNKITKGQKCQQRHIVGDQH